MTGSVVALDMEHRADLALVGDVFERMSPVAAREIFATRPNDDRAALFGQFLQVRHAVVKAFCIMAGTEPAAVLGASTYEPGQAVVWMIATPAFDRVGLTATRFAAKRFIPHVLAPNFARAHCDVWGGHPPAIAWLKRLGFVVQGVKHPVGWWADSFYELAWINPDPPRLFCPFDDPLLPPVHADRSVLPSVPVLPAPGDF